MGYIAVEQKKATIRKCLITNTVLIFNIRYVIKVLYSNSMYLHFIAFYLLWRQPNAGQGRLILEYS